MGSPIPFHPIPTHPIHPIPDSHSAPEMAPGALLLLLPPQHWWRKVSPLWSSPHGPVLLLEPRGGLHTSIPAVGRLRSLGSSERTLPTEGPRAGKGLGKEENLPSSQQRLLNHWLVAPQETPCHAHLDRHVPREAGQGVPGGCRSTPWHMQPSPGHSCEGRRGGCQQGLCARVCCGHS